MGLKRGSLQDWFVDSVPDHLAERARWLADGSQRYVACLPEGSGLVGATLQLARRAGLVPEADLAGGTEVERLAQLGRAWDADFLLLSKDRETGPVLLAGVVCFPSSWDLQEKIGRPLNVIHEPVPGLNSQIAAQIGTFLDRLSPGVAWERANWGLSASGELNLHPARGLARLPANATWATTWLRIERQALIALDGVDGILFAIRIETVPLSELRSAAGIADGFRQALRTMPEPVAVYKNIAHARASLLADRAKG